MIDHVRTARIAASVVGRVVVRLRVDLDDLSPPCRAQVLEIRLLVLDAALAQQLPTGSFQNGSCARPSAVSAIELAQMDAAQVIREVGCGDPQQLFDETHLRDHKVRVSHMGERERSGRVDTAGVAAIIGVGWRLQMSADRIAELQSRLAEFAAARDWDQFHSPKNLAMALSVEAAELVEEFQWLTEEQSRTLDAERRERVRLEMADVLIYLMRLADKLDVDLLAAVDDKIALNELKYPAERVRGDSRKYTEYD